jgi:hypothetical protein
MSRHTVGIQNHVKDIAGEANPHRVGRIPAPPPKHYESSGESPFPHLQEAFQGRHERRYNEATKRKKE